MNGLVLIAVSVRAPLTFSLYYFPKTHGFFFLNFSGVINANRPCPELSENCAKCFANPACIWCETSQQCVFGVNTTNESPAGGPEVGWCAAFYYDQCPDQANPGAIAAVAISYLIAGALILVNIITAIQDDLKDKKQAAEAVRASWWRSLRSSFAWV